MVAVTDRPHRAVLGASLPLSPSAAAMARRYEARTEAARSRLLRAYLAAGLFFMLVPGTLLGVWNLVQISAREAVGFVSAAWLQAHGHAQVFGWVGTFILGIGSYTIPSLRAGSGPSIRAGWIGLLLWTAGVATRWTANVYSWQWRVLLPLAAALELAAVAVLLVSIVRHRPRRSAAPEIQPPVEILRLAAAGFAGVLLMNAALSVLVALQESSPAIPHGLDQRFLGLVAWGFLAPFIWGYSARWLPVLLGLRPTYGPMLVAGAVVNTALGTGLHLIGAVLVIRALRLFERPAHSPRVRAVHPSFPVFIRIAYVWLLIAALLSVAAAMWDTSGGIWGASRHGFTVGFVAIMIMSISQRLLPAFAGARRLWSTRLMFLAAVLLSAGCAIRVPAEILAYQGQTPWAWSALPLSAILELTGITAFAVNMIATLAGDPVEGD